MRMHSQAHGIVLISLHVCKTSLKLFLLEACGQRGAVHVAFADVACDSTAVKRHSDPCVRANVHRVRRLNSSEAFSSPDSLVAFSSPDH